MKTTLGKILEHGPCGQDAADYRWGKLINSIGNDRPGTVVTFRQILESNGIKDAVWALRTLDYDEYCLFLADIAQSVFHLSGDRDVWHAIESIHWYKNGIITRGQLLTTAAYAAYAAAADAAADAAYAADAADAAADAARAARAAAYAAYAAYAARADAAAAYAAYAARADAAAAYAAADAAAAAYAAARGGAAKWDEIEQMFVEHFCGGVS